MAGPSSQSSSDLGDRSLPRLFVSQPWKSSWKSHPALHDHQVWGDDQTLVVVSDLKSLPSPNNICKFLLPNLCCSQRDANIMDIMMGLCGSHPLCIHNRIIKCLLSPNSSIPIALSALLITWMTGFPCMLRLLTWNHRLYRSTASHREHDRFHSDNNPQGHEHDEDKGSCRPCGDFLAIWGGRWVVMHGDFLPSLETIFPDWLTQCSAWLGHDDRSTYSTNTHSHFSYPVASLSFKLRRKSMLSWVSLHS